MGFMARILLRGFTSMEAAVVALGAGFVDAKRGEVNKVITIEDYRALIVERDALAAQLAEARRLIKFWWDEEGCTDEIIEDVMKFLGLTSESQP